MNTGFWNYIILFGIPAAFIIGALWGGLKAFKHEEEQAEQSYNPDKYRS